MKNVTKLLTKVLMLFALTTMLFQQAGFADITIQIGTYTGADAQYNLPWDGYYMSGRCQYIYTAAEMAGLGAGPITKIAFQLTGVGESCYDAHISIKQTALSPPLTGTTYQTGLTQVWTAATYTPTVGWNTFNFSTPFVWDGVSNIIVDACFNTASYGFNHNYAQHSPYTGGVMYLLSFGSGSCTTTTGTVFGYRANIQLTHQDLGILTGTVRNCITNAVVVGASVSCTGSLSGTVLTNGAGVYTMQYVAAGNQTVTATFGAYDPYSGTTTIVANTTNTYNFCMYPPAGVLSGVVTNASTGAPIIGAQVTWGTLAPTYSIGADPVAGTPAGYYKLKDYLTGTNPLLASKPGFTNFSQAGVTVTPPNPITVNIAMTEATPAPSQPFTAALNNNAVNLNWGIPWGDYVLIYDDGIQDNYAVWGQAGNMNAVKFTPLSYPITITGGYIDIGPATDYTVAIGTVDSIKVQVYDATGPGGAPGNPISGIIHFKPANFGWNTFPIPNISVTSGNFYLVQIQVGIPPNAAHVAIDNTNDQFRSFSKFVSGNGPWLPASGNFMIRATVNGAGGPLDAPGSILNYRVFRLKQTQEVAGTNIPPASWTQIGTPTATNLIDYGWPSLDSAAWRWAAQANYTGNRWSNFAYSNVLGKNYTAKVIVNVTLTCAATPVAGTTVNLTNTTAFPPGFPVDSVYTAVTNSSGQVVFPTVWKGNYRVTVSRDGYASSVTNVVITGNMTINVTLGVDKFPPRNMFVDPVSLLATWSPPTGKLTVINEPFKNFSDNNWSAVSWTLQTGLGNPAPCAEFSWLTFLTNYSVSLTSKIFTGTGSNIFTLKYDIYLNNYATTGQEQLDVEIQVGGIGPWTSLMHYDNSGASFNWTTVTLDLSAYTNSTFQIRFRAHGVDAFNINNWDVDNVIIASPDAPDPTPCILSYVVSLNGVTAGFPPATDTSWSIPGNLVYYGSTYTACVQAIYGSGWSTASCYTFISKFLWPPTNTQGQAVECSAYLTWTKPKISSKVHVPAFTGTLQSDLPKIGDPAGPAPLDRSKMDAAKQIAKGLSDSPLGSMTFGFEAIALNFIKFDLNNLAGFTTVAANTLPNFCSGMVAPVGQLTWVWGTAYGVNNLYQIDKTTGAATLLGNMAGHSGGFNGLALDPNTGILYGNDATANSLWKIDPTGPSATLLGSYGGGSSTMIGICCDMAGNLWGHDVGTDRFWSINKATGAATLVGPLGWQAYYAQCEVFDPATMNVIICGFNLSNYDAEIRAVDVTTGSSVILSSLYYNEVTGAYIPMSSSTEPAGLIGYKIYRDNLYIDTVSGKNHTWFYDYNVAPGMHKYEVSALYDLTKYPPNTGIGESMKDHPANVNIVCGRDLPFFEPWTQASFGYNDWTAGHNWSINTAIGNPAPCADWSWIPHVVNYRDSLVTPVLNAAAYTCASIWADFDLKLVDHNATGKEILDVDVFVNGKWKNKATFANNGSFDWTAEHVDISNVLGKGFTLRFNARGVNSNDILHWYVDNIHIYAVCTPPTDLVLTAIHDKDVTLSWTAPNCNVNNFTNPHWITWDDGTNFTSVGYGGAYDFGIAGHWTPAQIATLDGGAVTKIRFWPSSAGTASYTLRVWTGVDGLTMVVNQPLASVTNDDWNEVTITTPVPIDITQDLWIGLDVNSTGGYPAGCDPGPAVAGFGDMLYDGTSWGSMFNLYGLNFNWDVEGYIDAASKASNPRTFTQPHWLATGKPIMNPLPAERKSGTPRLDAAVSDSSSLQGYNVYRSDDNKVTYHKINSSVVLTTTYTDPGVAYQQHFYYVSSVFAECESDSSNVVEADVVMGINPLNNGNILIYPNPATDLVKVVSSYDIKNIQVLNYIGQVVFDRTSVNNKQTQFNVSNFESGVYFVKVTTDQGIKTVKITVTK